MLRHFGINKHTGAHTFRTVTPAALRRVEPTRKLQEAKIGAERRNELERAAGAVLQALRHANMRMPVEEIRLQREPFEGKGERAEAFATGTRFSKHQLWHVEVTFSEPCVGPIMIGDGRFCGLGIKAAAK